MELVGSLTLALVQDDLGGLPRVFTLNTRCDNTSPVTRVRQLGCVSWHGGRRLLAQKWCALAHGGGEPRWRSRDASSSVDRKCGRGNRRDRAYAVCAVCALPRGHTLVVNLAQHGTVSC